MLEKLLKALYSTAYTLIFINISEYKIYLNYTFLVDFRFIKKLIWLTLGFCIILAKDSNTETWRYYIKFIKYFRQNLNLLVGFSSGKNHELSGSTPA